MFTFLESFEMYRSRTKGSYQEWRRLGAELWARIKSGPHFHTGTPCRDWPTCERYQVAQTES